jgi:hypothetical protein
MIVDGIGDCSSLLVRSSTSSKITRSRSLEMRARAHGTLKEIHCENNRMLRVVYPASGGRIKRSLLHIVSWMQRSSSIPFRIANGVKHRARAGESGPEGPMNLSSAELLSDKFQGRG